MPFSWKLLSPDNSLKQDFNKLLIYKLLQQYALYNDF
jgi:hypothetical protein